jgi:hypothetical protein
VGLLQQVHVMFGSRGLFKGDRTSYCATVTYNRRRHHEHMMFAPKFLCPGSNDFSAYIFHLDYVLLLLYLLVVGKCNTARLIRTLAKC